MVNICFCYADEDQDIVQNIANELATYSVDCLATIEACDTVIFVFSIATAQSERIQAEIAMAFWKRKPIIPVLLERGSMVNYLFLLDDDHVIDATEKRLSPQGIARQIAEWMRIEQRALTSDAQINSLSHPTFPTPITPDEIADVFYTATELTIQDSGQAIFLYRYLLKVAPDFAEGKALNFVKRIEDNLKSKWLKQLKREADQAIENQAWDSAQWVIDDMLAIENMEDAPLTHPVIERLKTALLDAKWVQVNDAMAQDNREGARYIAMDMLNLKHDEARALELIDRLNRMEECDAMYEQAIQAHAKGRKTALGVLLGHIFDHYPAFEDTQRLLRHFPITPEFVWSIREVMTLDMHRGDVYCLAMLPDGSLIASGSAENTIRLWSMPEGQQVAVLRREDGAVRHLSFSQDGQYMISLAGRNTIRIWAMPEGREILAYESETNNSGNSLIDFKSGNRIGSLTFIPDGRGFVTGFVDGTIKFTDIESGDEFIRIEAHTDWVNALTFSSDGRLLVSGSADHLIHVWDIQSDRASLVFTLDGHKWMVNHVAISPDGRWVASAANESMCKVWNVQSGKLLFSGAHEPNTTVKAVAFSSDGRLVASAGGDSTIRLWEVESGNMLGTFKGHARGVNTIIFSPDGTQMVSGGTDRRIKIWGMV